MRQRNQETSSAVLLLNWQSLLGGAGEGR